MRGEGLDVRLLNKIFGSPEGTEGDSSEPSEVTSPPATLPPQLPPEQLPPPGGNRRPQHPRHALVVSPISVSPEELRLLPSTRQRMPTLHGLGAGAEASGAEAVPPEPPPRSQHPDPKTSSPREMSMPIETNKTPKQTLVEQGTEFKGTIKSSCAVVVNGTIDGEVDAPEVTITQSGTVIGTIKAKKVRSSGTLSGNVDAGDVFLSGNVRSNTVIKAKSLEVKLGSSDRGQIQLAFGDCNIEAAQVPREEDSTNEQSASVDSAEVVAKELHPSPPSPSPELNALGALSTAGLGQRSPWKSSRMIEASAPPSEDAGKTTLR